MISMIDMGCWCCIKETFLNFLGYFSIDNWIEITGILVDFIIAVFIVNAVQKKIESDRVTKDYFIKEFIEIRNLYKNFFDDLEGGKIHSRNLLPWFKYVSIRTDDALRILNQKYGIELNIMDPYVVILREWLSENQDFVKCYGKKAYIKLSEKSMNELFVFQQNHNHIFNDVIVKINESDMKK